MGNDRAGGWSLQQLARSLFLIPETVWCWVENNSMLSILIPGGKFFQLWGDTLSAVVFKLIACKCFTALLLSDCRKQFLNRRMIACCRTYEKVLYVLQWRDYDGTSKLQGVTLKRTGLKPCFKSRKSMGKRCHPDDIGEAAFKLQIFIRIPQGVGEQ